MARRVVVVGGGGFVGTNLLLRSGDLARLAVDREFRYPDATGDVGRRELEVDGSADLARLLREDDVLVHLAARSNVADSVRHPVEAVVGNLQLWLDVLEAARAAGVRRIVLASTAGAIAGRQAPPFGPATLPRPVSPYGASKAAAEAVGHAYAASYDLDVRIVRFGNVIGPWSWHKPNLVPNIMRWGLGQAGLTIVDGSQVREYTFVEDVCDLLLDEALRGADGDAIVHAGSGVGCGIEELIERCRRLPDFAPREAPVVRPGVPPHDVPAAYSAAPAGGGGSRPIIGLDTALERTWDWFRSRSRSVGS
jgi:UDP-glucose 4-epimerase